MLGLNNFRDMPIISRKIVECDAQNADFVMKNRREDVKKALVLVTLMRKKRKEEGLLALEDAIVDIKERNAPCVEFLAEQIIILVDGTDMQLMTEIITKEFLVRNPDDFEALVLYIYMLALIMVRLELDYELIMQKHSFVLFYCGDNIYKVFLHFLICNQTICLKIMGKLN